VTTSPVISIRKHLRRKWKMD